MEKSLIRLFQWHFHQFETSKNKSRYVHNSEIMSKLQELKYLSGIEFENSMLSYQDGESTSFVRSHVQNSTPTLNVKAS
jgi:hypothetical protein